MSDVTLNNILNDYFKNKIAEFEIYYIIRTEDDDEYSYNSFYCNMPGLKGNLQNEYINRIYEVIQGKIYEEFDVIGSQADSIEILDSDRIDNMKKIKDQLNKVSSKNASELNVSVANIWGYVVTYVNNKNKKLCLFRKFTLPKAFNEKRKLSIVNGNLKEITDEIFILDLNIDAIELDGKTYVINKYYFERFFSFDEEYVKCVESSMEELKKENVIDNFDEFSTRCLESSNLVRKLVYVVKQNRLQWLKKNIAEAKNVVDEYKLKVKIEGSQIVYSKKDCNISDVMKLICGCCVKDAVDMHKYFASSVKEVS